MGNAKFKVGDIIRNKNPYWGEPAYRLVGENEYAFFGIWTGSKYGPPTKNNGFWKCQIDFSDLNDEESIDGPYQYCKWWMRLYLYILGNTYGRINKFKP